MDLPRQTGEMLCHSYNNSVATVEKLEKSLKKITNQLRQEKTSTEAKENRKHDY